MSIRTEVIDALCEFSALSTALFEVIRDQAAEQPSLSDASLSSSTKSGGETSSLSLSSQAEDLMANLIDVDKKLQVAVRHCTYLCSVVR